MFKRSNDITKTEKSKKPKKPMTPEKVEAIRKRVFTVASSGAGLCAGLVIDAGLNMIVPPVAKPVTEIGFKVGKKILSVIGGDLVRRTIRREIEDTYDDISETAQSFKGMIAGDVDEQFVLEEVTKEEIEQTYEVDD